MSLVVPTLAESHALADYILEYNTVNALDAHELEVGVPTILEISVRSVNPNSTWGIGGVIFDFHSPKGGLGWDLNGPDAVDFTEDDGFVWQSGLDDIENEYFASVDPPFTVYMGFDFGAAAVQVPPGESVLLATLDITAGQTGDFPLIAGSQGGIVHRADHFGPWSIKDGSEQVTLTVVPEPGALGLLVFPAAFLLLRRKRSRCDHDSLPALRGRATLRPTLGGSMSPFVVSLD